MSTAIFIVLIGPALIALAILIALLVRRSRNDRGDWQVVQEGGPRGSDVNIVVASGLSAEAAHVDAVNRSLRSKVQHRAEPMLGGGR